MLYNEFMDRVKEIALITNERNHLTYIRPDYEYILAASEVKLSDVSDFEGATMETVHRQLELERDMRNAQNDNAPVIMQWLSDIITTIIEPAVVEEQNKLIKDMIEYRKERNAIDDRTKELDLQQKTLEEKSKIMPLNFGLNFSKKKP